MESQEWTSPGSYQWTVPDGVERITLICEGATGYRNYNNKYGGYASGVLDVTPGETLYPYVGGSGGSPSGGFNGGGDGGSGDGTDGGGGGGASDIRRGGETLNDRIIVAGGAAGGSYSEYGGGAGGGTEGENGESSGFAGGNGGGGGTQSSGGSGGSGENGDGSDGEFGIGGTGGANYSDRTRCGGGGGGGWYGGGGGGAGSENAGGAGGGGGSGYVEDFLDDTQLVQDGASSGGDGRVRIEWWNDPPAPTDVTAQVDVDQIVLDWTHSGESVKEYRIYRDTSSTVDTSGTPLGTTETIGFTDTGVNESTSYFYVVQAYNPTYTTDSAEIATATNPTNISATTQGTEEITISWTHDGTAVEVYEVYRAESSGSRDISDYEFISSPSSYPMSDTGLINGRQYYYRVRAITSDTESALSTEGADTTELPDPVLSNPTGGNREVTIDFEATDNNPDGNLEITRDGVPVTTVGLSTTSYTDTDATLDGHEYEYQITRNTGDATATSTTDTAITDLPSVIDLTVESIDGRYVTVSWVDPSNNSSGYRLLLSEDDDGTYQQDGSEIDPVGEDETATHQSTELLDGQLYGATVETFTDYTSAREDQ